MSETFALRALANARQASSPPVLQRKCACGNQASGVDGECDQCRRDKLRGMQRKARHGDGASPFAPRSGEAAAAGVGEVLGGSGRPLAAASRQFFERRFGHDFGHVRIHADARAAESAQALDAHAYTSGHDIVFARGRYDPLSDPGRRLLAHELTHVVQQRAGLSAATGPIQDSAAEREAERNAALLDSGMPLIAVERAPALARRSAGRTQVTVTAPTGPPGCGLDKHRKIAPAVHEAQRSLKKAVDKLDAFIAKPADKATQATRAALDRHFHSTRPAVAQMVRDRVEQIRVDMVSRDPFTVECHDDTDTSCGNSGAYVHGESLLVFCEKFFTGSDRYRVFALVHEMAHALIGLDIDDRAYGNDRLLPRLTTAEALDNAESYEMLVKELATGRAVEGSPPKDKVEDCNAKTQPLIAESIARAQRWNRDAEVVANDQKPAMLAYNANLFTTHLGDAKTGTRNTARKVYGDMVKRLKEPIDVRCDDTAGAGCGAGRHAYKGSANNIGRGLALGAGIGGALGGAIGLGAGIGAIAGGASLLTGFGLFGLIGLGGLALGTLIGLIAGAATRHAEVRVCPSWASLATADDRTEALLAAIYEGYAGRNAADSARHAALARAIHKHWWPPPPAAPP